MTRDRTSAKSCVLPSSSVIVSGVVLRGQVFTASRTAAVQHRVPVVGVGHPGLEVVGDHLLRAAADIGEGADMGTEPVLVTLGPARFGVGQVRAGQAGNENLRLADDIL